MGHFILTDAMKIGLAHQDRLWFGVLVDPQDQLAASAFTPRLYRLDKYLGRVGQKLTHSKPRRGSHPLAEAMVDLYRGRDARTHVDLAQGITSGFQEQVYKILRMIPRGRVTSYGMIASSISSGPRAVGNAVASNPWSLFVPCHRVVPSSLTVGNYSMNDHPNHESSIVKKELLKREGVFFQQDKILPTSLWKPRGE